MKVDKVIIVLHLKIITLFEKMLQNVKWGQVPKHRVGLDGVRGRGQLQVNCRGLGWLHCLGHGSLLPEM